MTKNTPALPELVPVQLPARAIHPPKTISDAAQAALATLATTQMPPRPLPSDLDGWRRAVEASDSMWEPIAAQMVESSGCSVETQELAGVTTYLCTPASPAGAGDDRVYLYLHGGAFVFGGGRFAMGTGATAAGRLNMTTIS